jgi:hypothetical protein
MEALGISKHIGSYLSRHDQRSRDREEITDDSSTAADQRLVDTKTSDASQTFTYSPLDHSRHSIRLLRVLPELSKKGYVQCEVRHSTIDSEYTCLSYVWGDPSHNWIEINGQPHSVRDNLLSFLQSAQRKPPSQWLWIDAISIHQTNVAERTHQVQQMSLIFSNAVEVISWLGSSHSIARCLRYINRPNVLEEWVRAFIESEYWKRAWVTQEILLARKVRLMAGDDEFPLEDLPARVRTFSHDDRSFESTKAALAAQLLPVWPTCFLGSAEDFRLLRGRSLIQLIGQLKDKKCAVRRDRIFSVLGICGEGSTLSVDYESTSETLAMRILSVSNQSFCLCSLVVVCGVLGISFPYDAPVLFDAIGDVWIQTWTVRSHTTNLWLQTYTEMVVPIRKPLLVPSAGREYFDDLSLRQGAYTNSSWSDLKYRKGCCPNDVQESHLHDVSSTSSMLSIPAENLCADLKGGFTLRVTENGITYHRYMGIRGRSITGHFRSANHFTEHLYLKYSKTGKTCTVRFSLAMLYWLKSRSDSSNREDATKLSCCSRVLDGNPVLRLATNRPTLVE